MFTYTIQLAGSDFNQYDEKGPIDFEGFTNVLYTFPWIEQMQLYNVTKEGASATISVINNITKKVLWVSIAGNENKNTYLIGYVFNKSVKGFLGFGKDKIKRWVDIYSVQSLDEVINFFNLFFSEKDDDLLSTLSLEERFDSMAAPE